ncbi:hypothetical protein [Sphingomonas sp.]
MTLPVCDRIVLVSALAQQATVHLLLLCGMIYRIITGKLTPSPLSH